MLARVNARVHYYYTFIFIFYVRRHGHYSNLFDEVTTSTWCSGKVGILNDMVIG